MNRITLLSLGFTLTCLSAMAQPAETKNPQETAKSYTRDGDYTNAIVVLNAALQKDPQNIELSKDLAFNYYLEREYSKGLNVVRPLLDKPNADVQTYQIMAMLLKGIDDMKECEKLYKAGVKRFPKSGVMYSELGEVLWARADYAAIKMWEKGIEVDPNYSSNYYHAAQYYFFTYDKVWSLVYGEMFINLESYTARTAEMKQMLLEGYKKLFVDNDMAKNQNKSPFAAAFLNVMGKLSFTVRDGLTAESLTVLRTKFIINWFNTYPTNFPFRLFDYEHQLLKDGMYDAYNQWIFGAAQNPSTFQSWSNTHADEYARFTNFQHGRVFKTPEGQYYQTDIRD